MDSDSEGSYDEPDMEEITLQMFGKFDPYRLVLTWLASSSNSFCFSDDPILPPGSDPAPAAETESGIEDTCKYYIQESIFL